MNAQESAVVKTGGKQYRVCEGSEIVVDRLSADAGSVVSLPEVLMVIKDGAVSIGTPFVDGAVIEAKVMAHVKGRKVTVFKKKRRQGYKRTYGHRQLGTKLLIEKINCP